MGGMVAVTFLTIFFCRVLGDNNSVRRVASSVNVTFLPQLKCYHQHEFRRPVL